MKFITVEVQKRNDLLFNGLVPQSIAMQSIQLIGMRNILGNLITILHHTCLLSLSWLLALAGISSFAHRRHDSITMMDNSKSENGAKAAEEGIPSWWVWQPDQQRRQCTA